MSKRGEQNLKNLKYVELERAAPEARTTTKGGSGARQSIEKKSMDHVGVNVA